MVGRDRQSMADCALETKGSAEAVFDMARRSELSVSEDVKGTVLESGYAEDAKVTERYRSRGVKPACGEETSSDVLTTEDGSENILTNNNETIEYEVQ